MQHIDCAVPKGSKRHFLAFSLFYWSRISTHLYTSSKNFGSYLYLKLVFFDLNIFLKGPKLPEFISIRVQATLRQCWKDLTNENDTKPAALRAPLACADRQTAASLQPITASAVSTLRSFQPWSLDQGWKDLSMLTKRALILTALANSTSDWL